MTHFAGSRVLQVRWSRSGSSRDRGGGQGDDPEHPWAHALGQRANRSSFSGAIATFEHDDDAQALLLDPALEMTEPDLQFLHFLFVLRSLHRTTRSDRSPALDCAGRIYSQP
jgi:hypothetical protein